MAQIKGHDYIWSKSWIEFKAPNAQGVYCIRTKEGNAVFVGKGNVRDGLLSHWNKENSVDASIWESSPYSFTFELADNPTEREAELIRVLKPSCFAPKHSFFHRHGAFPLPRAGSHGHGSL